MCLEAPLTETPSIAPRTSCSEAPLRHRRSPLAVQQAQQEHKPVLFRRPRPRRVHSLLVRRRTPVPFTRKANLLHSPLAVLPNRRLRSGHLATLATAHRTRIHLDSQHLRLLPYPSLRPAIHSALQQPVTRSVRRCPPPQPRPHSPLVHHRQCHRSVSRRTAGRALLAHLTLGPLEAHHHQCSVSEQVPAVRLHPVAVLRAKCEGCLGGSSRWLDDHRPCPRSAPVYANTRMICACAEQRLQYSPI